MKQLAKYLLVGLVNTGLGYAIIFGCMYLLRLDPLISNALGYGVGISVSYALNKDFTFDRKASGWPTFVRFICVSALAYGMNFLILFFLIEQLQVHAGWAQVIAGVAYVGTSFVVNKFYVFRDENLAKSHVEPLARERK